MPVITDLPPDASLQRELCEQTGRVAELVVATRQTIDAIWDWRADATDNPVDTGYTVHGKPAEGIIAAWFLAR